MIKRPSLYIRLVHVTTLYLMLGVGFFFILKVYVGSVHHLIWLLSIEVNTEREPQFITSTVQQITITSFN